MCATHFVSPLGLFLPLQDSGEGIWEMGLRSQPVGLHHAAVRGGQWSEDGHCATGGRDKKGGVVLMEIGWSGWKGRDAKLAVDLCEAALSDYVF